MRLVAPADRGPVLSQECCDDCGLVRAGHLHCSAVETILGIVQVIISIVMIFLILLHSAKDAGLSGAFGIGGGGSSFGGGSLVERNLDRWTIFFAVLFVVNTIVLLKI